MIAPPRRIHALLLASAVMAAMLAAPTTSRADGMENSYLDFQALQHKYEQEKKVQLQEGFVLESLKDKSGRKTGTLSFGGQIDVADPYQGIGARTNFRGRTINEIDGPKINLRLSF